MTVNIQGIDFTLPPKGKVFNIISGEFEKRPYITSSSKKSEQVWMRTELPENYEYKRNEELSKQAEDKDCLLYTSPSPRDLSTSRMPSSA